MTRYGFRGVVSTLMREIGFVETKSSLHPDSNFASCIVDLTAANFSSKSTAVTPVIFMVCEHAVCYADVHFRIVMAFSVL